MGRGFESPREHKTAPILFEGSALFILRRAAEQFSRAFLATTLDPHYDPDRVFQSEWYRQYAPTLG